MSENASENNSLLVEKMTFVRNTEGWSNLNERQRQMIELTREIQDKSDHGDPVSKEFVSSMFCHAAILSLETGKFPVGPIKEIQESSFFDAAYLRFDDVGQVQKAIEKMDFPCVVHVGDYPRPPINHTFLALGHNTAGELITWGKLGFGEMDPFYIRTLKDEFEAYGPLQFWGIRKLRNLVNSS